MPDKIWLPKNIRDAYALADRTDKDAALIFAPPQPEVVKVESVKVESPDGEVEKKVKKTKVEAIPFFWIRKPIAQEVCRWNDQEVIPVINNVEGVNGEVLNAGAKLIEEVACIAAHTPTTGSRKPDYWTEEIIVSDVRNTLQRFDEKTKDWVPVKPGSNIDLQLKEVCTILRNNPRVYDGEKC